MDQGKHEQHHAWISEKIEQETTWADQWRRIRLSLLTTVMTSAVLSLFGLVWWAFVAFIERGGK